MPGTRSRQRHPIFPSPQCLPAATVSISVKALAGASGWHWSYFSRCCSCIIGCSVCRRSRTVGLRFDEGFNGILSGEAHSVRHCQECLLESVAQQHPVDLGHLARYTGGEAALDAEILQLFATQSAGMLRELGGMLEMRDAIRWRQIVHSLKGAAMGIGAFGLADAAAEAE